MGLDRRRFLKSAALGAAAFAGARPVLGGFGGPGPRSGDKPNILIIHTDQQNAGTLSIYGQKLIETPHIDSIGRDGAVLTRFFTNSAVCTPSRGCFLTGRYPHAHGAYKNNIPMNRDEITFARVCGDHGYDTGYAGKWHLDGTPKPGWMEPERSMGFADCRYMYNRGHWKKIEEIPGQRPKAYPYKVMGDAKTYTTDWLAAKTLEFIETPREKPFCFMVSIPDPHTPYKARPPYDTMLDPAEMLVPENIHDANVPEWAGKKRVNPGTVRKSKAFYLGSVKCIDDAVGRILEGLKARGILDDTVVVFTTDHGDYMGEHGLMAKNNLYETAYRIPFLIRWPKKIPAGLHVDRIVSTVDFMPTLLSLIGLPVPDRVQGRDASGLLRGEDISWTDEAHIHHSSLKRAGIFTPEYELAYVEGGTPILFDRKKDPDQLHNLHGKAGHHEITRKLFARIRAHNDAVKAPAAEWLNRIESSGETKK